MSFLQAVGRVIRVEKGDVEPTATVYIPAHKQLIEHALTIKNQRVPILDPNEDEDIDERPPDERIWEPAERIFISSKAGDMTAVAGDRIFSSNALTVIDRMKRMSPETAGMSSYQVALLLDNYRKDQAGGAAAGFTSATETEKPMLTDVIWELRDSNSYRARTIALRFGLEFKYVNGRLNALVGIQGVASCSDPAILRRRLKYAKDWLRTGLEPNHGA
jgi:hypothetical protein